MSEEPPWARPRADTGRLFAARRVREEAAEPYRPERPPPTVVTGPPPGPMPPTVRRPDPSTEDLAPNEVRRDAHVGLIVEPVVYTRIAEANRPGIGVVAVVMSAVIALLAVVATALGGRAGGVHLLVGVLVPVACVAGVILANQAAFRRGLASELRFVIRAETGDRVAWTLRGAAPAEVPRAGDLIRVVPGPERSARVIEVLAGPDGPVLRRITGHARLARVRWAGLALAGALLVLTTAVLWGAI